MALKRYVAGRLLPVRCLGLWRRWDGTTVYRVYKPIGNRLSAYVRLEPLRGGRAQSCYEAGGGISKTTVRGRGAKARA